MALVVINYWMFLPRDHHRRPRNTSIYLDLMPGGAPQDATGVTPPFFEYLPYTLPGGGSGLARCLFWSITGGTNGEVRPPGRFYQPVSVPLTITAWYFPISGPGVGEGRAIIVDAFSANLGRFIDDDFVDVTSDPSLTHNANVIGVVPTDRNLTLVARNSVSSTPEPFFEWILNERLMAAGDATLNIEKNTTGIAIAIYQYRQAPVFRQLIPSIWPLPPGSITDPIWWPTLVTRGGPPEPWVQGLTTALALRSTVNEASPQVQSRILEAALQQVKIAASQLQKQIKILEKE